MSSAAKAGHGFAEEIAEAQAEIDAVRHELEAAVDAILHGTEHCTVHVANESPDVYRQRVKDACIKMVEVCAFQDLAGQRMGKVSRTLNALNEQLSAIKAVVRQVPKASHGNGLLNGPQLPGQGLSQSEADRLMD